MKYKFSNEIRYQDVTLPSGAVYNAFDWSAFNVVRSPDMMGATIEVVLRSGASIVAEEGVRAHQLTEVLKHLKDDLMFALDKHS